MTPRTSATIVSVLFACCLPCRPAGRRTWRRSSTRRTTPAHRRPHQWDAENRRLLPLYWDERTGSLWLEIPRFDTEFLYTTGLAAGLGSNDIGSTAGRKAKVTWSPSSALAEGAVGAG